MSQLLDTTPVYSSTTQTDVLESSEVLANRDELILTMETTTIQESSMTEEQKIDAKRNGSPLEELFEMVIDAKGETRSVKVIKSSNSEWQVEGLSNLALHSFLLKAEQLGKNITCTKTMKVSITD